MVELRKRKTPPPAPEKPARKAKVTKDQDNSSKDDKPSKAKTTAKPAEDKKAKAAEEVSTKSEGKSKEADKGTTSKSTAKPSSKPTGKPEAGDTIDLEGFGGTVTTQDGKEVTLKSLVDESENGVVLFTYPKASTPGCTTQACAFRDNHPKFTSTGLSIYGLSADSPKSNTTFKTKQSLPYDLLCDPGFSLIGAIGMRVSATEKKTKRGVLVVDKKGMVLVNHFGGPLPTVEVVRGLVEG